MKKVLMIAAAAAFVIAGATGSAVAGDFNAGKYLKKCSACHKTKKDKTGPGFKTIQAAYGSADALAAAFIGGLTDESRAVANTEGSKYNKKRKMMTSRYKKLIKKLSDDEKKALAAAIFAK